MQTNGRNGKLLVVSGSNGGASVLVAVLTIGWNALRSDMTDMRAEIHDNRTEIRDLRVELRKIQDLAAERGKTIPELQRRIERLEEKRK